LTWLVGGINIHVIHHLLPNICHIHYADITPILKETVAEFNLDYREHHSFSSAVYSHLHTLKVMGSAD
jgi:linoleoyl-CoA desaturase